MKNIQKLLKSNQILKKLLLTTLATATALSITTTCLATTPVTFSDVTSTDWSYKYISKLAGDGYVSGKTAPVDGVATYAPNATMTRAEYLVVVTGAFFKEHQTLQDGTYWYSIYFDAANKVNIMPQGWSQGSLNQEITREEMAYIAYKTAMATGEKEPWQTYPSGNISDYSSVSNGYHDAILFCFGEGIIAGRKIADTGHATFAPNETMTRAECAVVLYNLIYADQRAPVDFTALPDYSGVQTTPEGNQVIQQGEKSERPLAQAGDIVIDKDGNEVVLVVGPSGVLGEGQGVAANEGLQWPSGGEVVDGGAGTPSGTLNSLGEPIGGAWYWVNQITGEGHWSTEWSAFDSRPTDEVGTFDGDLSSDMNWYWSGNTWLSAVSKMFTEAQLEMIKADNGLT